MTTDPRMTGDPRHHPEDIEGLRAENDWLRTALVAIRDTLADSCPAWALEWDKVRELPGWSDEEEFTVQEVREAARAVLDPIAAVIFEVKP